MVGQVLCVSLSTTGCHRGAEDKGVISQTANEWTKLFRNEDVAFIKRSRGMGFGLERVHEGKEVTGGMERLCGLF